jgi:hypothetical protein
VNGQLPQPLGGWSALPYSFSVADTRVGGACPGGVTSASSFSGVVANATDASGSSSGSCGADY